METTRRTNSHDRSSQASRAASEARPAAMVTVAARAFRLRGCRRCGGDGYLDQTDEPEWRCLQCARVFPTEAAAAPVGSLTQSEDAA